MLLVCVQLAAALQSPSIPALRCTAMSRSRQLIAEDDLSKHTVVQLKERLRAAGLPVSGRKAELISRLRSEPPAAPDEDISQSRTLSASLRSLPDCVGYPPIEIEACRS